MTDKSLLNSLKIAYDPRPERLSIMYYYCKKLGVKFTHFSTVNPDRVYCEAAKLLGKPFEEFEEKAIARETQLKQLKQESEAMMKEWEKERQERRETLAEALGCTIEEINAKIEELKVKQAENERVETVNPANYTLKELEAKIKELEAKQAKLSSGDKLPKKTG